MGARAVQQSVLTPDLHGKLHVFSVWTKINPSDSLDAAARASGRFASYPQVIQFYDPLRRLATEVAQGFAAPPGEPAWDMYLFYGKEDRWGLPLPLPVDWAHQLRGRNWADPRKLVRGEGLTLRLRSIAEEMMRD